MRIKSMKFSFLAVVIILLSLFSGCGFSFNTPFPMPIIPSEELPLGAKLKGEIYLQEVGDLRQKRNFFTYSDRVFTADADVGPMVRESLSKSLTDYGIKFSKKAPYIYKVNVLKWDAELSGEIILEIKASTEIQLAVFDRGGKRIYAGKYMGEANVEKISHDNESALQVLGLSMRAAINKLVADPGLNKLISNVKMGQ